MSMIIYKCFSFDAAHFLPNVPAGHKCGRMHGHTYHLKVFVSGEIDPESCWFMDFSDLKAIVNPLIKRLDHHTLNEIDGLENPTSESLMVWIWEKLKPLLPALVKLELQETPGSGVIYEG
nr:6-carboxytetrahydropterin synthase QueD [Pedobacter nutrimenti]